MRLIFLLSWLAVLTTSSPAPAAGLPIVADLSKRLVAITTGFSGSDVLLFGATDGPGDIVLVVRGPPSDVTVRKKDRFGPIWANRESVTFRGVPSFYRVASTRDPASIIDEGGLQRHQIGFSTLDLKTGDDTPPEELAAFRQALLRLKAEQGLYSMDSQAVSTLDNQLFRSDLRFPANVPTGAYSVEVYLVRNREVVTAEMTPLSVGKIGLSAEIAWFAREYAAYYGLAAVLIAVAAGWAAGAAFRSP